MALLELWWIRPQADREDFIECEWNNEKTMKQDSVSAPKLLVCLGVMALVLGIGYRWARSPRSSPPASASTLPPTATQATDDAEPREVAPSQFIRDSQPPAVIPSTARYVSTPQPAVARVKPSPQTRQLVASLTNRDLRHGSITENRLNNGRKACRR